MTTDPSPNHRPAPRQLGNPILGPLLLFALLALGLVWYYGPPGPRGSLHDPNAMPRAVTARGDLAADEKATIELFKAASPSVLFITNLGVQRDRLSLNLLEIPRGSGSGFVWDDQGNIVTNFHVVQQAEALRVTLADGSTWPARPVGGAPDYDLAVVKIDAPKDRLKPIMIGTSSDLQVGQKVFAIGNPFGLDQSLTTGVISALGREIKSVTERTIADVIQTDAAINPGNSGGPLLDSAGRLIGVNSAIFSPSGAFAGIGFAIPVDTVNQVVPELIRSGKATRPGLGVKLVDPQVARRVGVRRGVLVLDVVPGSAAESAGIRPTRRGDDGETLLGDIIVAVNGQSVEKPADLLKILSKAKVGQVVRLTVLREDGETAIEVKLQGI